MSPVLRWQEHYSTLDSHMIIWLLHAEGGWRSDRSAQRQGQGPGLGQGQGPGQGPRQGSPRRPWAWEAGQGLSLRPTFAQLESGDRWVHAETGHARAGAWAIVAMVGAAVKGGAGNEPHSGPTCAAALELFTIAGNLHSTNLLCQAFAALKNLQIVHQGAISRSLQDGLQFCSAQPYLHSLTL